MAYRCTALLVVTTTSLGACASDPSRSATTTTTATVTYPAPLAVVSDDRTLDVSYSDEVVELSFARLDQPFRAMHAQVLTWSDEAWRYYGTLRTENADTVGTLTTDAADLVEVLDGVNIAPMPDRYHAPGLPAGRYLVCTNLVEPDGHSEVCGELLVD